MLKLAPHHYFSIFPWIQDILSWKKSALVLSEIFRLFVNTLTSDDRYSGRYVQIFWQELQTLLSQEEKTFSAFLLNLWNVYCMKFRTFWKKEEYTSLIITEVIASERDV